MEEAGARGFESIQTSRAVAPRAIQDSDQQKWFAVQLVVSDRPVNLEAMPRLDIFAAYRLYAIGGRRRGKSCYALRLGFFSEVELAQVICKYVKTFFRSPSVVRVSVAEQARFERVLKIAAGKSPTVTALARPSAQRSTLGGDAGTSGTSATPAAQQSGRARSTQGRTKFNTLTKELLEEARKIELAKRRKQAMSRQKTSWLSRLLGRSNN